MPLLKTITFIAMIFLVSCRSSAPTIDITSGGTFNEGRKFAGLHAADQGFLLYDLEKETTLISHNAEQTFIPASTSKNVTALAALDVLGGDHTFKTSFYYTGYIDEGILHGDLYMVGEGDPHFSITDLFRSFEAMRRIIKEVRGGFFYDDSLFPAIMKIDEQMEDDASYNPSLGALSLNFNSVQLYWKEDKSSVDYQQHSKSEPEFKAWPKGDVRRLQFIPDLPIFKIGYGKANENEPERWQIKMEDDGFTHQWYIPENYFKDSKYAWKGMRNLPVKNPGAYTAYTARQVAERLGFKLVEPRFRKKPTDSAELYTHTSRTLKSLLYSNLLYSNNLLSELVLLATARRLAEKGKLLKSKAQTITTLAQAGKMIENYYRNQLVEANWNGFRIVNGSGLTSQNRISPQQMVSILVWADRKSFSGQSLLSMLPISGWSGSLRKRMYGDGNAMRVFAKTGTIFYGIGLAGFAYSKQGKRLVFAQFASDLEKRKNMEDPKHPLYFPLRKNAFGWIGSRKALIDRRLSRWLNDEYAFEFPQNN